jgi:hypothetical protein
MKRRDLIVKSSASCASPQKTLQLAPRKTATDMPVRLAMKCLQAALPQVNSFVKVTLLLRENAHPKTTCIR